MLKLFFFTVAVFLPVKCLYVGDSCFDEDRPGTCKNLFECKPVLDEVLKAGNPMPSQIRKKLQKLTCGFDQKDHLVCCAPGNATHEQINTLNQLPDIESHPNLSLLPPDCGIYESDIIVGGNRTRLFELPWIVILSYDTARGNKPNCDGSLISEWYVLTAAHCVSFLGETLKLSGVVLGEYDVCTDPDCETVDGASYCAPKVQTVDIAEVIAHPGYSPQTLVDDIALLRLAQPANFSLDSMKAVCLPSNSKLQNENLEGMIGTVAGWSTAADGLRSSVLLSVGMPIIKNEECTKAYKGISQINERQLCAVAEPDKFSCVGDSGGPLIYPGFTKNSIHAVQRGIVSYGPKLCGNGRLPRVYTRVAYYMDWILDNLRK